LVPGAGWTPSTYHKGVAEHISALHEGRLVRTTRLVRDFFILVLGNHRVAGREQGQELADDARRLVARGEVVLQIGERKDLAALRLFDDVGVGDPADRTLAELHLVAGERAGLVAEDVLDLTELLDEGRSSTESRRVGRRVIHVCSRANRQALHPLIDPWEASLTEIVVDETGLLELDHLHRDNEAIRASERASRSGGQQLHPIQNTLRIRTDSRDRDQVTQSQAEREHVLDKLARRDGTALARFAEHQVPHVVAVDVRADGRADRAREREGQEDDEEEDDLDVDEAFHRCALDRRGAESEWD
jgi:hypothetical protein